MATVSDETGDGTRQTVRKMEAEMTDKAPDAMPERMI